MKKVMFFLLVLALFAGCSLQDNALYAEKLSRYQSNWALILNEDRFLQSSQFYNINVTMDQYEDGTYEYELIIDSPLISMYDIEVMVVENREAYHENKMMLSVGIMEDIKYNMIPNQVRFDTGFVNGFLLSGQSGQESIMLRVMVSWKDYSKLTTTREFFEFSVRFEELPVEDDTEAETDEDVDASEPEN